MIPVFSAEDAVQSDTPALPSDFADRASDLLKRQEAVVAIGRRAIALPELSVLMHDAALLMAEMLDCQYGAVIECVPQGDSITLELVTRSQPGAAPQLHRLPAADGQSLAAYTLQGRYPIMIEDLAQEKRFQDPLLKRLGVKSALSVPLAIHESTFGALAALSTGAGGFASEDVFFAETIAHLVATTIGRKRTADLLAHERRLAGATLDTIDALVLLLDAEGRIQSINRAGRRMTGFAEDELRARPIWSVFSLPADADRFKAALSRLQQGQATLEHQGSLLTKTAQKRQIAWNLGAVRDKAEGLKAVVATGIVIADGPAENTDAEDNRLPLPIASGKDRRTQPRKAYPYKQLISPMIDGRLPPREGFLPVDCHDISPGGFSFIAPTPPPSDSFVVALGRGETFTYLIAQVAHMTRLERNGERVYLIGCSYMGRAEY